MYKRYPSVQSMSAFIHAARSGSFSSAARKLDLTHSALRSVSPHSSVPPGIAH